MSIIKVVVLWSVLYSASCQQNQQLWIERIRRSAESTGSGEVSGSGSSSNANLPSTDALNIGKTLVLTFMGRNKTSSKPNINSLTPKNNCSSVVCYFNLLTQPKPTENTVTTLTENTSPTGDEHFIESESLTPMLTVPPSDRVQSATPRTIPVYNYDPHQESNVAPGTLQIGLLGYTTTRVGRIEDTVAATITPLPTTTSIIRHDPDQENNIVMHSIATTTKIETSTLPKQESINQHYITESHGTSSKLLTITATTTLTTSKSNSTVLDEKYISNTVSTLGFQHNITEDRDNNENFRDDDLTVSDGSLYKDRKEMTPFKFNFRDSQNHDDPAKVKEVYGLELISHCGVFPACHVKVEFFNNSYPNAGLQEGRGTVVCRPANVHGILALNITLMILIIASNILICVVTFKSKVLRKPHGYFKVSLAVADLLTGVITLPGMVANITKHITYDPQKDFSKQIVQFTSDIDRNEAEFFGIVVIISQIITVYSILLLSIDSFLSIRWPVKYSIGDLMTPKRAAILISITWFFAIVMAALPVVGRKYVEYSLNYITMSYSPIIKELTTSTTQYLLKYTHGIVYIAVVWGLPFLTMWIITLLTAYYSRSMLQKMMNFSVNHATMSRKSISKLNRDVFKTVAVVLLLFSVTTIPLFLAITINALNTNKLCQSQSASLALFWTFYIFISGSFLNVFVYNLCNAEFRVESVRLFKSLTRSCCPDLMNRYLQHSSMSKSSKTTRTTRTSANATAKRKQINAKRVSEKNNNVKKNLERPQTIGSSLPPNVNNHATSHDVYYSNIVGHENPVFEMTGLSGATFGDDKIDDSGFHCDGEITPRTSSNNGDDSSHGISFAMVEQQQNKPKMNQLDGDISSPKVEQTSFTKLPNENNCIEYTI